jgi:hypothetical protein
MGKGDQKGDKAFSSVKLSGGRMTPMKGDVNQYAKNSATGMDKNFSKGGMSGGRFTPFGSTDFVNKPVDIKWTPLKVIIFTLIFMIPYGALIYIVSSVSPLITSLMVGTPIVIGALFYFIHLMTKDL